MTAFHCASFQRTSLAFVTTRTRQSSSSFLLRNRHQHQQHQQHRLSTISSSSTFVVAAATATTENKNGVVAEEEDEGNDEQKLMQDMLYRIRKCNEMPENVRHSIIDFQVDGAVLGKVDPKMAEILCSTITTNPTPTSAARSVFEMATPPSSSSSSASSGSSFSGSSSSGIPYLTLSKEAAGTTVESRTQAVAAVMEELKRKGIVTGWRDELYPISDSFYNPPFFLMERAATSLLGALEYGVHINGIVVDDADADADAPQPMLMWMARRSKTKSKYPGMVDHIVAGGQPAGLSLMENVIKECEEEAGIPQEIARPPNVRPAGVVSYEETKKHTIRAADTDTDTDDDDTSNNFYTISRVVLFNYDLYLPKEFVPKPVDGEVEEFFLWNVDQIKKSMAPDFCDPIKPNCYLVIIDYLLRMGYVSPETKGYLDVVQELRSGDCR